MLEYVSVNESYLWLVDAATGTKTELTPRQAGDKVAYGGADFATTAERVYVTTDRGSEFRRLACLDLATGEHSAQPRDPARRDGSRASPDGDDRLRHQRERRLAAAPARHPDRAGTAACRDGPRRRYRRAPLAPQQRILGFTVSSARSPATSYSLDPRRGPVDPLDRERDRRARPAAFAEPELVRWKSFDGRAITGFLYRPPARFTGKRPVMINIHGGPEGQSGPASWGASNYYLNELGVALIYPNVRGSTGYGKTFLKLDNGDAARGLGQGHRRAARLDRAAARPRRRRA